jgi:hypothetical protein
MRTSEGASGPDKNTTPCATIGLVPVVEMRGDFQELRDAIRAHDSFAAEAAWEKCERWVDQLDPAARRSR